MQIGGQVFCNHSESNIENERFTFGWSRVVVKTLNLEISRVSLADYVKELF